MSLRINFTSPDKGSSLNVKTNMNWLVNRFSRAWRMEIGVTQYHHVYVCMIVKVDVLISFDQPGKRSLVVYLSMLVFERFSVI